MKRFAGLLLLFARPLHFYNTAFTALALFNIYSLRGEVYLPAVLLKLVGYGSLVAYQHFMDGRSYYFFLNSGHSILRLYTIVFAADILFFLLVAFTLNHFHAFAHIKGR